MSHKKKPGTGSGVSLSIVITPMLDMSFQLLAFFIMVYTPNSMERFIEGSLGKKTIPKESEMATKSDAPLPKDAKPLPSAEEFPEIESNIIVAVRPLKGAGGADAGSSGKVARLEIKLPEESTPDSIEVELRPGMTPAKEHEVLTKAFKNLEDRLKDYRKKMGGSDAPKSDAAAGDAPKDVVKTRCKIEGDPDIMHDYVMQTYAACKRAGFDEVTFISPL